jgi:putative heme-binding domain-containing protein
LLALAEVPAQPAAGQALLSLLQADASPKDRWLTEAATAAAARHDASFLQAAVAHRSKAISPSVSQVVRTVTAHYASRAPVDSIVPTLVALDGTPPEIALPLLDGLVAGWPANPAPRLTATEADGLRGLGLRLAEDARASLMALLERWDRKDVLADQRATTATALRARVTDPTLADDQRLASARRWMAIEDSPETARTVLAQLTPQSAPAVSAGLLAAVGASRRPDTAETLLASWPRLTPGARRSAISVLLRRPEWANALLQAVEQRRLDRSDLAWDHWAQLREHPDKSLATRAAELEGRRSAASGSPEMEATIQRLLPVARQTGDPERGRLLFETTCQVCHALNGKGARIGPDLTGMGSRPKADLLVEILDPNRSVEANYRLWTLVTKSGDTFAGRLDTETTTSVELLDTTGQKHAVQRSNIASLEASNLSLMPSGFDQLPAADLANLLEYLARSVKP